MVINNVSKSWDDPPKPANLRSSGATSPNQPTTGPGPTMMLWKRWTPIQKKTCLVSMWGVGVFFLFRGVPLILTGKG